MRCFASQITLPADKAIERSGQGAERENAAEARAFEAILVSMVVRPLESSLGPLGAALGEGFSRTVLERDP